MPRTLDEELQDLHPTVRHRFAALADLLEKGAFLGETPTIFRLFEGYRSPLAQDEVYRRGTSKARSWQSAHQYGLAADFVPWINGAWSWTEDADWAYLKAKAKQVGLDVPITWDKPHVEAPEFQMMKQRIRNKK